MFKKLIVIETEVPTSVSLQKPANAFYRKPDQSSFYFRTTFLKNSPGQEILYSFIIIYDWVWPNR
jgi:hypothetical protein